MNTRSFGLFEDLINSAPPSTWLPDIRSGDMGRPHDGGRAWRKRDTKDGSIRKVGHDCLPVLFRAHLADINVNGTGARSSLNKLIVTGRNNKVLAKIHAATMCVTGNILRLLIRYLPSHRDRTHYC